MEEFGRNEAEKKDLKDIELNSGEASVDEAREGLFEAAVVHSGFSRDRIEAILGSMEIQYFKGRTQYIMLDKGHQVVYQVTEDGLNPKHIDIYLDKSGPVRGGGATQLEQAYAPIVHTWRSLNDLTPQSEEYQSGIVADLLEGVAFKE